MGPVQGSGEEGRERLPSEEEDVCLRYLVQEMPERVTDE